MTKGIRMATHCTGIYVVFIFFFLSYSYVEYWNLIVSLDRKSYKIRESQNNPKLTKFAQ